MRTGRGLPTRQGVLGPSAYDRRDSRRALASGYAASGAKAIGTGQIPVDWFIEPNPRAPQHRAPSAYAARTGPGAVRSHHGADLPRHELEVAVAELLGLGALAGRYRKHAPEDLLALGGNRHAVEHLAAVDVHVVDH